MQYLSQFNDEKHYENWSLFARVIVKIDNNSYAQDRPARSVYLQNNAIDDQRKLLYILVWVTSLISTNTVWVRVRFRVR